MAIPAHLWITDESGSPIKGSSLVKGREGSIEVLGFSHALHTLADGVTGALMGSRVHSPMTIEKEFDRVSPFLYRAVARGLPLQTAVLNWYRIDDSGTEQAYFTIRMENIRVVTVQPQMHNIKDNDMRHLNHIEQVELRYRKIEWTYLDGNISFSDAWGS
ncbi:type VI secretion system tube protein Hcp [Dyella sp. M7H15-1]|uniref:type VI secretion system tube protein TssD n=1 Tax=Dyella sp. M7H15-1 TaxID=2501295 RepID=UPI001004F66C|nr:type VI secretion system tube protein TssD [Dyella sp. M7H15-1]QAU24774.1 type VI secretion system tube protein Hcp [Dyella sp. M7H15-1]